MVYCKGPGLKITNLKCEYLPDPVAIESQHPTLSWQLTSVHRAKSQKAYHILVASSIYLLDRNMQVTISYHSTGVYDGIAGVVCGYECLTPVRAIRTISQTFLYKPLHEL